ncbi:hypothetical protein C8R46DRAFT_386187 [Mycena filopes]|nr:hypothetical protein C8R46DRAFT_386187 [Mycena filopes]
MGAEERVPNELWLEVLKNLQENADRGTLSNFSVASRAFRSLAFPSLFSKFHFSTPYYIATKGTLLLPSPTKIDQHMERLAFWTSPEVAPFVRQCHISAHKEHHGEAEEKTEWAFSTDTPYMLLDAVFQRLAQFTGLKQLHANDIHFTQARVDIICRLPITPFRLNIYGGSVAPGEHIDPSPHTLRVSHFILLSGGVHWIPLLHPESLHSLATAFDPRVIGSTDAIPIFPNVRTLTTKLHPTSSQNRAILCKFPGVRVLNIAETIGDLSLGISAQTPPILRLLREYYGPHQVLRMLTPAATLTHLRTSECSHMGLVTTLRGIGPNRIVSFHARFSLFDSAILSTLVELLPHLTKFAIDIVVATIEPWFARGRRDRSQYELKDDEILVGQFGDTCRVDFQPSTFFLALSNTPAFPSGLERLAISWKCYDCHPSLDQMSAYRLPKFEQLRDKLVERCPRLAWVFFHGYYYKYEWQITPDGLVKEETKTTFSDTQSFGLNTFWDTYKIEQLMLIDNPAAFRPTTMSVLTGWIS